MKKVTALSMAVVLAMLVSGCVIFPSILPSRSPSPVATFLSGTQPDDTHAPASAIIESTEQRYAKASDEQSAAVNALLEKRQQAIRAADVEALLTTVSHVDPWYMQEQKNLVRSLTEFPVTDFSVTASGVMCTDQGELKATVTQRYTCDGTIRTCSYVERFVLQDGSYLDAGLVSLSMENDVVRVTYPDSSYRSIARQSINTVTDFIDDMSDVFGYDPAQKISIRFYDDAEVFTESIKLHLTTYMGGWNEYKESLKLMMPTKEFSYYKEILFHESAHFFLGNMTNDNASIWMQEGLATMMQNGIEGLGECDPEMVPDLMEWKEEGTLPDLQWLSVTNPELLLDSNINEYYAASNAAVAWFLETYGFDVFQEVCAVLLAESYIEGSSAEKIAEISQRTMEAMEKVTGDTQAAFDASFAAYLDKTVVSANGDHVFLYMYRPMLMHTLIGTSMLHDADDG